MHKPLLLLAGCLLLHPRTTQAQVELDDRTGQTPLIASIKRGYPVVFSVRNLNPYVRQVSVNGMDQYHGTDPLGLWLQLSKAETFDISLTAPEDDTASMGALAASSTTMSDILSAAIKQTEALNTQARSIMDLELDRTLITISLSAVGRKGMTSDAKNTARDQVFDVLRTRDLFAIESAQKTSDPQKDIKLIGADIDVRLKTEKAITATMTKQLQHMLAQLKADPKASIESLYAELRGPISDLRNAQNELNGSKNDLDMAAAVLRDPCLWSTEIITRLTSLAPSGRFAGRTNVAVHDLRNKIDVVEDAIADFQEKALALGLAAQAEERLKALQNRLLALKAILADDTWTKAAHSAEIAADAGMLTETYNQTFNLGETLGDLKKVSYTISNKTTIPDGCNNVHKGSVEVWKTGGFRIDWGGGIAVAFGAHDEVFSLSDDPAIAGNRIVQRHTDDKILRPALMASLLVSTRSLTWARPSVMLGFGANLSDITNSNLYCGPGLLLGDKHIIGIHAGPALLLTDRLSKTLDVGGSYSQDHMDAMALTRQKLTRGWFISISYMISKRKDA